jgi:Mrp family chromosome partitioning ATPase
VPLLGVLPELPKDLSDPDQTAIAVHSVHKIRAMLQLAAGPQDGCKTFAITSPAAGDGKTSLTLALGLSFAACGARTLLVDFDLVGNGLTRRASRMIRPKLGSILRRRRLITLEQLRLALSDAARKQVPVGKALMAAGLINAEQLSKALQMQKESLVGLLDVIAGEPLDECVSGADVNGLFILPVGSARASYVGRLSPRAVRTLLEEARKEFDVVLVDTGPVLGSLEASILAPAVDGVVLTVSRDEQRTLARRSMDHLISTGGRVLGVVFNRARHYDVLSSRFSSSTSIRLLSRPDQVSSDFSNSEDSLSARLGPVGFAVNAAEAASRSH